MKRRSSTGEDSDDHVAPQRATRRVARTAPTQHVARNVQRRVACAIQRDACRTTLNTWRRGAQHVHDACGPPCAQPPGRQGSSGDAEAAGSPASASPSAHAVDPSVHGRRALNDLAWLAASTERGPASPSADVGTDHDRIAA